MKDLIADTKVACGIDLEHPDHVYLEITIPRRIPAKTYMSASEAREYARQLWKFARGAAHNAHLTGKRVKP